MKTVTPTELRSDIYRLLDEVLATGIPLEVKKGNHRLRIISLEPIDKLQNLIRRPNTVVGDPEDLVDMKWDKEVNLDLP